MIRSFRNQATEDIFNGVNSKAARKACPQSIWRVARRKLDMVNAAHVLSDLKAPPQNKLERLEDDRKGQWAIRINDQYRVCFRWADDGAEDVEVTDYHCARRGRSKEDARLERRTGRTLERREEPTTMVRIPTDRPPAHPGEVLADEFLTPLGITQTDFAEAIDVSYPRLNEIIHGKRGVTPDTALRLERALGTTAQFWLNLQQAWDLYHAMRAPGAKAIERIRPIRRAAG